MGLGHVLRLQRLEDSLVEGAGGGEVGDGDRLGLSLSIQPGAGLLIQLQAPGQREPHEQVATGLQIHSVPSGSGVDQAKRDVAPVPRLDFRRRLQFAGLWEATLDAFAVVSVPVGDEDGLAVGGLDDVFEGIEFRPMQLDRIAMLGRV